MQRCCEGEGNPLTRAEQHFKQGQRDREARDRRTFGAAWSWNELQSVGDLSWGYWFCWWWCDWWQAAWYWKWTWFGSYI